MKLFNWLNSLVIVTCLGLPIVSSEVHGDQITIESTKDNTLYESPTGALSNGAGEFFFAGRVFATGGSLLRRGLIQFDVSDLPTNASIDEAVLTLFMSRTISGNQSMGLHLLDNDWGEGTSNASGEEGAGASASSGDATWIHRFSATDFWDNPGGDFNSVASAVQSVGGIDSYQWTSAQMASDVQGWLTDPSQNFGWELVGNEAGGVTSKQFFSRENADVTLRPQLTITFTSVPEPSAVLVLGVIWLGGMCRRRRSSGEAV